MDEMTEATEDTNVTQPPPLRVSRMFHAPRATVFKAWSSADHVRHWFAPETYTVADAAVEMSVGGKFDVCMRSPSGEEHWTRGVFVTVTPETRLVIEMRTTDADGVLLFRVQTEVDFLDALCGTRLELVQRYTLVDPRIAAPMVAGAAEGWRSTLYKLEKEVLRMQGATLADIRSVVHATFQLERCFKAPVARVWRALTDGAAKSKWFDGTPGHWELIERHLDVRVGGTERLKGRWDGGVVSSFDAIYHDVIPNERLVYSYTMHMDDMKISVSLATLQLKEEGRETRLKLTEQGAFLDGYDDAGSREHGTGQLLDALEASLKD